MGAEDWEPLLTDLAERRARTRDHGPGRPRREPAALPVRERIEAVVDPQSFTELGGFAGTAAADGFVAGRARVRGGPVFIGAEDPSYQGGSIGVAGASKRVRLAQLAGAATAPLILILDGAGHRATNLLEPHRPAPNDLQLLADLVGRIPLVTVVAGPSAGHGALAAPFSDLVVMAGPHAALFTAGPPVVRASLGEEVDKRTLGGPEVHCGESGLAHLATPTEEAGLASVRDWLGYAVEPQVPATDTDRDSELLSLIPVDPRRPYDMRQVIAETIDRGRWLELQPDHGPSLITGLARIGGRAVALVANQPLVLAGALDVAAAEKGAGFLGTCQALGLPVVFLTDNPGVLAGSVSERAGILRSAARMYAAQRRLTAGKLQVTLRKAYGFGSSVMAVNPCDNQWLNVALPTATLGGIPARLGAQTSGAGPELTERLTSGESAGPWRQASSTGFDDVIAPAELRRVLVNALVDLPIERRRWTLSE